MNRPASALIRRLGGLLLLGAAFAAAPAAAGTLQVDPITVELSSDRKIASVKIRNEEAAPVTIRAYVLNWTQENGEDVYEESSSLILSPPVFTIKGGGTQLVRVGLRNPAAAGKAYRLIVEEVPEANPGTGVKVALRLNLPLFAMMATGEQSDLSWSARKEGDGWTLEAVNRGKGWVRVDPDAASKTTGVAAGPGAFFGVVLPGNRKTWAIGPAPRLADPARFRLIAGKQGDDPQLASR
jgi:fimbrial chaperone protein